MTSRLIGRALSRRVSRCPDRLVVCRADGIGARAGSRRRDRGAAGVGQEALPQVLLAVPRREGGRRRLRHAASAPQAPRLHDGQVQGPHDSQRSAPDPSGPRQHHQARHALHLDARLAHPLRPGSVGSRLLHHDLLPRLLEPRECPAARAAPERAERHERVDRAREEALRGDRLRQVPRHARSGRRTFGSNADGRLGPSDTRGGPRAELDLPGRVVPRGHLPDDEHGVQRHADAVVRSTPSRPSNDGRSPTSSSRSRGATGLAIPTSSSPSTSRIRSIWRRGPRASNPLLSPAFRSSDRSWSPDARSILPRPP